MRHTFTLANGVEIPAVGFGTYKAADNTDEAIISEAIRQLQQVTASGLRLGVQNKP